MPRLNGDGRKLAVQITIKVWDDGAMSVEGPTHDLTWCLAALENAKDAIRNHRSVRQVVVPGKDVSIEAL